MFDLDRLDALRLRFDAHPMRFGVPYAEALRRAGQLEVAIAVMRTVLAQGDRNVLGLTVLARCLRDLGHPEEAGIAIRAALALDPNDPVGTELAYLVPFAPAQVDEDASEPVIAVEDASAMERDDPLLQDAPGLAEPSAAPVPMPSVFVTQTMAELYVQQGLPGRALAIYRELTMRAPDDARLAARLAEVVALADEEVRSAPPVDALSDLPLLEDFDPIPVVEPMREAELVVVAPGSVQEVSEPESVSDEPAMASAFDFSDDAARVPPPISAMDQSMLADLSFEAISLPTPAPDGAGLDLPVGTGPSAREVLRQLANRPVTSRAPRRSPVVQPPRPTTRTSAGTTPSSRAASRPPADPTGDDFDQWLRGLS